MPLVELKKFKHPFVFPFGLALPTDGSGNSQTVNSPKMLIRLFESQQLGEINANQSEHHIRHSGRKKYCGYNAWPTHEPTLRLHKSYQPQYRPAIRPIITKPRKNCSIQPALPTRMGS